jgi:hypothetical protein
MKTKILLSIITIFFTFELFAQAPQAFKYQAVVRDNLGAILPNRTVSFRVTIRRSTEVGTIVYRETYTPLPQTNQFGIVNLNIGTGTASDGVFSNIAWGSYPYFLQLEVDINGGINYTNMGATQLLSVPYALYAAESGNSIIQDADKNTKITTENAPNEEYIRFFTNGNERMRITPSGKFETTANSIYLGNGAGKNNSSSYNVIIGDSAAATATGMSSSVAIGYRALYANTTGDYNAALGALALSGNISGSRNTAIGRGALASNVSGSHNQGLGYYSLGMNTTGNSNIGIGYSALYSNTTSSNCIAIGEYSLYSQNGFTLTDTLNNIAIGNYALYKNKPTSASNGRVNLAIGHRALYNNTTGYANTGIGTEALALNSSGNYNTAVGTYALKNSTGSFNSVLGRRAGEDLTSGGDNTFIGYDANPTVASVTNSIVIGSMASVNASNKAVIGNASVTTVGGYGNWTNYSDLRLKENVKYTSDLGLNFITKLKTASYNYIEDKNKHRRDGLIAQDVQKALQELGVDFSGLVVDDDPQKTLNLAYGDFVLPLINAVQELNKQNEELIKRVKELENKMVSK